MAPTLVHHRNCFFFVVCDVLVRDMEHIQFLVCAGQALLPCRTRAFTIAEVDYLRFDDPLVPAQLVNALLVLETLTAG